MITPQDAELLAAMAGVEFAQSISPEFIAEYELRLGMLSRCGITLPGIGAVPMMHLLREFQIQPRRMASNAAVSDWRQIAEGAKISYQSRGGRYVGPASDGQILIQLDGYRGSFEVRASEVEIPSPMVADVADSAFAVDHVDELSDDTRKVIAESTKAQFSLPRDLSPPGAPNRPAQGDPRKADDLFAQWQHVDAGTEVMFEVGDEIGTGKFVDVEGNDSIILIVGGEPRTIRSSSAVVPDKPEAAPPVPKKTKSKKPEPALA